MRWTIAVAAICGLIFSHPLIELVAGWYDGVSPVVRFDGTVVGRDPKSITIAVAGEKLRDCAVVQGSTAAFVMREGVLYDVLADRVAGYPASRPVGPVYLGIWRLHPVDKSAERVMMYVRHECAWRHFVTSQVFNVEVPK